MTEHQSQLAAVNHITALFERMLNRLDSLSTKVDILEQKLDHIIEAIDYGMTEDSLDDADISSVYGRERNNETL